MMTNKVAGYQRGEGTLPDRHWLWPLYGQGLDALGRDGAPIEVPLPVPAADQLLVRHDAVGLCFSDTKVIAAGESHPRLLGRDMKQNPVVLGHEVALTVVAVGAHLADRYRPGDRFIMQADIYYRGVGLAYGYALQGGLSQYNLVGEEILNGDEGCYLIPMADATGYAQGALTEPWACVVAAYRIVYRKAWKPGGTVAVVAGPAVDPDTVLGDPFDPAGAPAQVLMVGLPAGLRAELEAAATARGSNLTALDSLEALVGTDVTPRFDDLVLLGADAEMYARLEPLAAKGALIALVGAAGLAGPAPVDVGRLHYDGLGLMGTASAEIGAAYAPIRTEFQPGGCMALVGAAGPMGQMHFQRALQAPVPPRVIAATSRVMDRLHLLPAKYASLIDARSDVTRVLTLASTGISPEAFVTALCNATDGKGYDDVVILAPSAGVVEQTYPLLAPGGVMNIFAGLPRGTRAMLDLTAVVSKGVRLIGSSGSLIDDLRHMLEVTERGALDPNLSVVAVAGLNAAKEGLAGVMHSQYPGKVVIYPQVLAFPLTRLSDLAQSLPSVYAKLGPNESWTVEAERAFLEELLP